MPKRPCTERAEWRLFPAKAAQRLSPHYQLDCDYGTPLITIFRESDGNEPVYLCTSHVEEIERLSRKRANSPAAKGEATDRRAGSKREDPPPRVEPAPASRIEGGAATPKTTETAPAAASPLAAAAPSTTPAAEPLPNEAPSAAPAITSSAGSSNSSLIAAKSARTAQVSPAKGRPRDLTYGDSAKALVDEVIWNLEPGDYEAYRTALHNGKPALDAAQAAGGQLAVMIRKIGEYTRALEALLAEPKAAIDAVEIIHKPLEQATLELIGKEEISDAKKDAAIEQLGLFEKWLNQGARRELTPMEAFTIACAIGERGNWGATSELAEELKPAYGAVYTSLRNAIIAGVPAAAAPWERLANLYVAKAELGTAHQPNPPQVPELASSVA